MDNLTTFLIGIVIGAGLAFVIRSDKGKTTDDPTGEFKKQIADKLDKAIRDIKSTV